MKHLVISHAHPDISIGGAELAAYNLFKSIVDLRPEEGATFLARSGLNSLQPGSISQKADNEFLWRQDLADWFFLRSAFPSSILKEFRSFLATQNPENVFVQHIAHIGVEMLREIRNCLPSSRIILTLHEYVPICNRNGQMIKTITNRLCYKESLQDCHRCFPHFSEEQFWLRKNYIKNYFSYVDHFVSPSEFLRQRYIAWGVQPYDISVIENGQPDMGMFDQQYGHCSRSHATESAEKVVFGFFGQITEFKGVDIFLEAIQYLAPNMRKKARFEVHGANLEQQGDWLKDRIDKLKAPLLEEGCLWWAGSYGRNEAFHLISQVDWVVVPSIWWENSPMIIQEAFLCNKPVICSNIGGMAEKVKAHVDGYHFDVSNPFDLADKLSLAITDQSRREQLAKNIAKPLTYVEAATLYLNLVERHDV